MRPTCQLLKHYSKCIGVPEWCKNCDEYHYALLRARVTNTEFEATQPTYFYSGYYNPEIKTDEQTGFRYLSYHCPLLGYNEFIFPIKIFGVFMGAVFVGQILRTNDEMGNKIFKEFLAINGDKIHMEQDIKTNNSFLKMFIRKLQKADNEQVSLLKELRKIECCKEFTDVGGLLSCLSERFIQIDDTSFNDLLRRCINGVISLIADLHDCVIKKRESIICSILENISSDADSHYHELGYEQPLATMTDNYEGILRNVLYEGLRQFNIKSVRIYGKKKTR